MKAFLIVLATLSATSFAYQDIHFSIAFEGLEDRNAIKDGLKPSELSTLTVSADQEAVAIEELNIILARGDQPILRKSVRGNSTDLSGFRSTVRAGDRIVVKVMKISGSTVELTDQNSILLVHFN